MGKHQPTRSVLASGILSVLGACAWLALLFGNSNSSGPKVLVDEEGNPLGSAWEQSLAVSAATKSRPVTQLVSGNTPQWKATPDSADWPETRNPLADFDADFLNPDIKGFPHTTGTANWPSTKNPLGHFDEGFRAVWKPWEGPENNVYKKLPAHYPWLETKLEPDQSEDDYPEWKNSGGVKEHNVYTDPGYKFPRG